MAYAEELLEFAQELANLHPDAPHQPSLRRAVSTAYYALFHLLISEATKNWQRPELRAALGRVFDHGPMKQAADKKVRNSTTISRQSHQRVRKKTVALHLRNVADAFGQAQYHRNEADYNMDREWNSTEVLLHIDLIADAFKSWNSIREEPAAQAYLVSMLPSKERKQSERPGPERLPLTEPPKPSS
ncbi:MAG TPA: hypothetical protein VLY24_31460 [Bryobacteraceae bacterium]|nr:hypothetical protein [Bryobacteraceae bacterium]